MAVDWACALGPRVLRSGALLAAPVRRGPLPRRRHASSSSSSSSPSRAHRPEPPRVQDPGLAVVDIPGKGKGLVVRAPTPAGRTLLQEAPLVSHPKPAVRHLVCAHCLAPVPEAAAEAHRPAAGSGAFGRRRHCSAECAEQAHAVYGHGLADVEAGLVKLTRSCEASGVVFPLLAARVLGSTLQAVRHDRAMDHSRLAAVYGLAFMGLPTVPPAWAEQYCTFAAALLPAPRAGGGGAGGGNHAFFSEAWYARVLGVLNLNVFEVLLPPALFPTRRFTEPVSSGTALYQATSRINHSCDPNSTVRWGHDHTITVSLLRDLAGGEEVAICYLDPEWGCERRRRYLEDNYGFLCDCPRCQAEGGG